MKSKLVLVLAFAFFAPNLSAAQTKTDPATAKILSIEEKWNDTYRRGDATGMAALLSDDFIITVEDSTTFSKSGYLAHTADSDLRVLISDMSDLKVRLHGNSAVVTGAYHEKGTSKGKPYESRDRFTDVWMKTDAGWQLIASHYAIPASQ